MDSIYKRHGNMIVLTGVLAAQLLGLAVQIKRPDENGSTPLIRTWAVALISPLEKGFVHSQNWAHKTWQNYFYLQDVRRENESLRAEIEQMKLHQVRLQEDAAQARRIQALLEFKEQYISKTIAAQVIGSSGTQQSRLIYIDKGSNDGIAPNMAVITPEGIVGKVLKVWGSTAQVLEITDQTSGVGAALEKSRLQGILKGSPAGAAQLEYIMMDEKVESGEPVITSGGDGIFPKGLPIGHVRGVSPGKNMFLKIDIDPAAELTRLEEVLVITKIEERAPDTKDLGPIRAADILAARLPTVPPKQETPAGQPGTPGAQPAGGTVTPNAPAATTGTTSSRTPATGTAVKPATPGAPVNSATKSPAKSAASGTATALPKPTGNVAVPIATKPKPAAKPADAAAAPSNNPPPQTH